MDAVGMAALCRVRGNCFKLSFCNCCSGNCWPVAVTAALCCFCRSVHWEKMSSLICKLYSFSSNAANLFNIVHTNLDPYYTYQVDDDDAKF